MAIARATVSGSVASLLSTFALAVCGKAEQGDPFLPLNGPSQWIFGRNAPYRSGFCLPHTPVGYLIHHSMSVFWALFFEKWMGPKRQSSVMKALPQAAATAALACFVDYRLTPKRLTPGFEKKLSRKSLAIVYAAFAIGLAAGLALDRERRGS
jgi:hypothetical protein